MREQAVVALRLALAHHPLCHHFASHRFGPFCSGCSLFMPAFFASAALAVAAVLTGANPWALLAAGAVLGTPQLLGMARPFGRGVRAAVKLLGGVAVGVANVGIVMLPMPVGAKLALLGLELAAFAAILALRMRSILQVCKGCPWQRDWEHCPGFVAGAPLQPPRAS